MRIAVTGASGNIGTRVLERLRADPAIEDVVALARRAPQEPGERTRWVEADLSRAESVPALTAAFRGVDAVVHLAWLIQPSHRPELMRATNLDGSAHVLRAVEQAGVRSLVVASSVGAYSPGDKSRRVDESWPTEGIPGSLYSAHKAELERMLDRFAADHGSVRLVRVRPGIVLQERASSEQARYFLGRLVPAALLRPGLLKVLPLPERMVFQVGHAEDVAEVFVRAALHPTFRGGVNVADEPVITPAVLASALHALHVPVPEALVRGLVEVSWRLHLQPTDRGWVELGLGVPLMDTTTAREALGWEPRHRATDVLIEALQGIAAGSGGPTPVLQAATSPLRRLLSAAGAGSSRG